MIRVRQAGRRAVCGRCGDLIPPNDLLTASGNGGRGWRCMPCTINGLMRERHGVRAATDPPPLHKMGRTA